MSHGPGPSQSVLAALAVTALLASPGLALRFTEVTARAGLAVSHGHAAPPSNQEQAIASGVACGDYDGDGWLDLYVVRGSGGANLLFHNRGDGSFADVAATAGVALAGREGAGATFADVDGDGRIDLLVLAVDASGPTLFRNRGDGTFEDVTAASGLRATRPGVSAAFGDYDRDGDLDLFVTHWLTILDDRPTEHLWKNDGRGHFTDVSRAAGITGFSAPGFPGMEIDFTFTPNFTDVDADGWPDLLVASDAGTSRVFLNRRDGTFRDATDRRVITDGNGMGSAIGDYDNDGDLDWFVSSIWDPNGVAEGNWDVSGNRLYRGRGDGTFEDATDAAGVRQGYWGWASTFADLDNDGWLDLVHTNGWDYEAGAAEFFADPTRVFLSNRGVFTEQAAAVGIADANQGRALVAFDYDRDGDVDLLVGNNQGPLRLFRNDGPGGAYLDVVPRAQGLARSGIGARVTVVAAGLTQLREIRAGSNFESQDPAEAHFGLGSARTVDEVRVRWPNDQVTVLGPLAVNQRIVLDDTPAPPTTVPTTPAPPATTTTTLAPPSAPCADRGGLAGIDCHLQALATAIREADSALLRGGATRRQLRDRIGACQRALRKVLTSPSSRRPAAARRLGALLGRLAGDVVRANRRDKLRSPLADDLRALVAGARASFAAI